MRIKERFMLVVSLLAFILTMWGSWGLAAPTNVLITGEVERITINNPGDVWSGGVIVVGGQNVILPRNLLIDLPANRLTLQQLFIPTPGNPVSGAPAECVTAGESGLAKLDTCNHTGTGAFATIAANRLDNQNIIAGDVFIQKAVELVTGVVTYIDYDDGYFRINGFPNNPNLGTIVRLNDPTGRHTVQRGLGCAPGNTVNCSPDTRFTLDPDNYVNTFTTGYPYCIPSTVARTFTDVLGLGVTTAQSTATGTGDVLCPATNRSINGGHPVDDSRRFAPILVGDDIVVEGNFETIGGVHFLSAHTTKILRALTTKALSTQPDYMFLEEVGIDAPGFQNQRAKGLFIGFTTRAPADVIIWSLHRDPITNDKHEFPLGSTLGCDAAAGVGECTSQGLIATGADIFKINYDVDFFFQPTVPNLNPCRHLRADSRLAALNICPGGGTFAEQFAILSPIPHEIQARTGHKLANPGLITLDINGNEGTNGQYLFPFGIGLGGISIPEMVEIDLGLLFTPFIFEGIPWNLDRRLGPGGCIDTTGDGIPDCEATPQLLDPFPFSNLDPRTQALTPTTTYFDRNYTASTLSVASNRILSFVTEVSPGIFNFDGNNTLLSLPLPPAIINNGDFNGNGKTDILWRHAITGDVAIWLMDGTTWTSTIFTGVVSDTSWEIAGTGDLNGDQKTDILWRHSLTGEIAAWLMNGTAFSSAVGLGTVADSNWKIKGTSDFNGDAKADILWHHATTGDIAVWLMNGTTFGSGAMIGTVADLSWAISGVGDLNGDGNADILWRNSVSGLNVIWLMSGTAFSSTLTLPAEADTNWKIVGTGDFNGDTNRDILWRHDLTGDNRVWLMSGAIPTTAPLPAVPDTSWKIEGPK